MARHMIKNQTYKFPNIGKQYTSTMIREAMVKEEQYKALEENYKIVNFSVVSKTPTNTEVIVSIELTCVSK